ncbi:6-hydroxy-D-nicotine oxidase [Aspergillus pseudocaelatus]|uniref:6-hydroxy-D-nicotine oxidase n=1 Tax=Aspergillus pseudocaelatus TaxID=1825620 RepID=A0ABQ6W2L9_9EURO|nr:6-hydroxy-D-nicotine oxidase [Aspergillus pseudocaelatus]
MCNNHRSTVARTYSPRHRDISPCQLVTPDVESKYQAAVARPWSQTCWTPAAGYIYLSNIQELSEALAIVKKTGTKFAIRTTGHNPNAGFSNADESAIVLDIRGMGALPNLYGLGSDGVRNFEVLLADGRLINANANENADLHRVLKGGGSNYGIITRFDLEIHPLINVQYMIYLYNPDDHVQINKATVAVQNAMEDDPKIGLFTNFNNGFVAVGLLYGDTPAEPPSAFESFYNLKSLMTIALPTTNGTLLSLAQAMGHTKVSQKRAICTKVYKSWTEVCKALPSGCILHYTIQPMGKAGVQAGKDRGGNIMGHESIPQCWWVFTCEWPQEGGDDAAAQQAVDTMSEVVHSLAREKGLLLDFKCMSFAMASQRVLGSYGAENIKTMQEAAAKYDPEGVFQKLQYGGFLLRNNV